MSEYLYIVRNWEHHFEVAESRRTGSLVWLATPVKHDGLGYRRMMAQRDGPALFGAWNAIVQTAAKAGKLGTRGRLERDGIPLDAEAIALMTCFPGPVMERALEFFSSEKQGWLDKVPVGTGAMPADSTPPAPDATAAGSLDVPSRAPIPNGHHPAMPRPRPGLARVSPSTGQTEQDKQNTHHTRAGGSDPAIAGGWFEIMLANEETRTLPPALNTREFRTAWTRWAGHLFGRKGNGRRPSLQTLDAHMAQLTTMTVADAIRAIDHAISLDWSRPELPNTTTNGKGEHHARINQRTAGAIRGTDQSEAKLA